jgi:hypothetical protein
LICLTLWTTILAVEAMQATRFNHRGVVYYASSDQPQLLLLSGLHGDESGVIDCLWNFVNKNERRLPDYLYVPEVSATAVALGSRKNAYGHDLNRCFGVEITDREAVILKEIFNGYRFDWALDFHEDCDRNKSFYWYDTEKATEKKLDVIKEKMKVCGIKMYEGVDDTQDLLLNSFVKKGFVFDKHSTGGFLSTWLINNGFVKRVIGPEVPGKAGKQIKQEIVNEFMEFVLEDWSDRQTLLPAFTDVVLDYELADGKI